jgi:hypothetical protein
VRGCADVEVFGLAAYQEVPNAAADQIRGVIGLAEPVQHFKRVGIDIAAREYVLGARNDPRFGHRAALYQHVADAT